MIRSLATASLLLCLSPFQRHAEDSEGEDLLAALLTEVGEQLHYEVTHVAKTKTRIRGAEEVSQVHTTSQRHWDVSKPTNPK